jgi:hypothetical protein
MNKKPVDYKQYDSRWAKIAYNGPGETDKTIKSSGCGPTSAAMLIATLADKTVTPVETCAWSVQHGYKYANQGTAYGYFRPQFAKYGIECQQLLSKRIINQPNHEIHAKVKQYLADGYYIIALMGPGTWTTGGHYIVLWGWDDKVRINDSMSTKDKRLNGDPDTFKKEVRMYWLVDGREFNGNSQKEENDLTLDQFKELYQQMRAELQDNDCGDWSQQARQFVQDAGLMVGGGDGNFMWEDTLTREQAAALFYRFAQWLGKA